MHRGIERRKSERLNYKSAILHSTSPADFFYSGTMYNFSLEGLYFESNEDLFQGDEITISIKNPPDQFSNESGPYFDVKIMWSRDLQGASHKVGYGAKRV